MAFTFCKLVSLVHFTIYLCIVRSKGENIITIYEHPGPRGNKFNIDASHCSNVPPEFAQVVSALELGNYCARLYKGFNCSDDSIEILPNYPAYRIDIVHYGYDNIVRSVGPCRNECSDDIVGIYDEDVVVEIFNDTNYKGSSMILNDGGCLKVPDEFIHSIKSIKTFDTCIQLYKNDNCEVRNIIQSVELRRNSIFRENLNYWNFPQIKSISHCKYKCGNYSDNIITKNRNEPQEKSPQSPFPLTLIVISVAVSIATVSIVVTVIVLVGRKWGFLNWNGSLQISEKDIQKFLDGFNTQMTQITSENEGSTDLVQLLAQSQPYDRNLEISRSRILFDSMVPLGIGEYGVVYKGSILNNYNATNSLSQDDENRRIEVAIKTVKPSLGATALHALLMEVKVMLYVGNHPNIVQLMGCNTGNLARGEILVLLEFCKRGSLKGFLNHNRSSFINLVTRGTVNSAEIAWNIIIGESSAQGFDTFQIIKWAIDIARGMEFLSNAKVIHSDLAARNILLDENLKAKIADFGLSRQLRNYTEYIKSKQEPLPWRWMALESLTFGQFSTKSDVWSFAVLCWEMFTLGENPYPNAIWNETFVSDLRDGMQLHKPRNAPNETYNLMVRCWNINPLVRPNFTEIISELEYIFGNLQDLSIYRG